MSSSNLIFERVSRRINELAAIRNGGRNPWDFVNKNDEFDMHCITAMYIRLNAPLLSDQCCYVSATQCIMGDNWMSDDSDTDSDYSWADFNAETRITQACEGAESEVESGTESESDVY